MGVQDRIKVYKVVLKYLKLYNSVQDYSKELHSAKLPSNSNFHSCNTHFWLKKVVKKGYYGNKSLGLAWDRVKVCQINPFYTSSE